tara:strand:+ start:542 stop:736 length:195 start_codon:yes stop_codon:yes gene_type:complete
MIKIPRKESDEDAINKGVELMIRRAKRDSPYKMSRGLKINQTFVLFNKQLSFKLEFTWEDVETI